MDINTLYLDKVSDLLRPVPHLLALARLFSLSQRLLFYQFKVLASHFYLIYKRLYLLLFFFFNHRTISVLFLRFLFLLPFFLCMSSSPCCYTQPFHLLQLWQHNTFLSWITTTRVLLWYQSFSFEELHCVTLYFFFLTSFFCVVSLFFIFHGRGSCYSKSSSTNPKWPSSSKLSFPSSKQKSCHTFGSVPSWCNQLPFMEHVHDYSLKCQEQGEIHSWHHWTSG